MTKNLTKRNLELARRKWPGLLGKDSREALRSLSEQYGFSLELSDLLFLDGSWYVTHAGLLRLACRNRCRGIRVELLREFCDPSANRWFFKATVYKSPRSKGFMGCGDANPSNVSLLVRGAEMRVAETRAVNRALRKAYGIGLCSLEELGWSPLTLKSGHKQEKKTLPSTEGCSDNGQPRLRDRLSQLIRQYRLDPALVKRYASEFCGTESLREASRERIEAFINHLSNWATRNCAELACHLNSYAQAEATKP